MKGNSNVEFFPKRQQILIVGQSLMLRTCREKPCRPLGGYAFGPEISHHYSGTQIAPPAPVFQPLSTPSGPHRLDSDSKKDSLRRMELNLNVGSVVQEVGRDRERRS